MIIPTLAILAFKEALHDKVMSLIAVFAALMLAVSLGFGDLTLGAERKIAMDFGLGVIHALLVMLAVFQGSRLISRDLEQRIAYTLLSKPIHRSQLLIGKYLGACMAFWLLLAAMSTVFYALIILTSGRFDPIFLGALLLIGLEAMVVMAVTVLFTTMTAPLLSLLYALGLFVIGHNAEMIRRFGEQSGALGTAFSRLVYYGLPNLETFDIKNQVVYGGTLPLGEWVWAVAYGICVTVALIALATLAFDRKELP